MPLDPIDPTREQLVQDLASQAGLVLRNERLTGNYAPVSSISRQRRSAWSPRRITSGASSAEHPRRRAAAARRAAGAASARRATDRPRSGQGQADARRAAEGHGPDDLRDLARGIYPPLLADKGLVAALEAQARAPVPVSVRSDGFRRYPQDVETAVYFSVLEALQNVAKYAEATSVEVSLDEQPGAVRFAVHDDGRGFDPDRIRHGAPGHRRPAGRRGGAARDRERAGSWNDRCRDDPGPFRPSRRGGRRGGSCLGLMRWALSGQESRRRAGRSSAVGRPARVGDLRVIIAGFLAGVWLSMQNGAPFRSGSRRARA